MPLLRHFHTISSYFISFLWFWADWASSLDWYCQDWNIQGAGSLWSWLVLCQSWWAFPLFSLCPHTYICYWQCIINMVQPPLQGRSTWGEVLVLVPSVGFTVEARGMEAVHHISARAVVLLPDIYYNSCRKWTSSTLTQRGEFCVYISTWNCLWT